VSLRTRLVAAAVILLVAVMTAGVTIVRIVPRSQRAEIDRELIRSLPFAVGFARPDDVGPPPFEQPFEEVYVARLVSDGTRVPIVVAPSGANQATPAIPSVMTTFGTPPRIETVPSTGKGPRWRAMLLGAPGSDRVLVALSLQRADTTSRQVRLTVLAAGLGILLVLGLAGWWVLRLGLNPIAEITEAADAITAGDRTRRVVGRRRTEAGHLARAFNVMLDEHQADEDRRRRFVADASHELRTPVAAVRGFADLYRNGGLDDPEMLGEAMRRIGDESKRMAGLVDDLVLLARLDEGRALETQPVDLSRILRDAAFDTSATHPNRRVTSEVADGLVVLGDDARLRQVLANVVHNALTHGGANASLVVRGWRQGELCVVEVSDDGAGMEPEQAARAFDRFYRSDRARARHANGAGLGLSIARAITEAHHGRVTLESATGRGTTVRLVLPAA